MSHINLITIQSSYSIRIISLIPIYESCLAVSIYNQWSYDLGTCKPRTIPLHGLWLVVLAVTPMELGVAEQIKQTVSLSGRKMALWCRGSVKFSPSSDNTGFPCGPVSWSHQGFFSCLLCSTSLSAFLQPWSGNNDPTVNGLYRENNSALKHLITYNRIAWVSPSFTVQHNILPQTLVYTFPIEGTYTVDI